MTVPELGYERSVEEPGQLLADPRAALAGAVLEALDVREPREIELSSDVPYGSGLGGSSALTVAMAAAVAASVDRRFDGAGRVEFVRDVETRVLGKPAGTQDYYPPLAGGVHTLRFEPGGVAVARRDVDPGAWLRHLTLFDTGAAHSSGMNNWEIFRARLEGDHLVSARLDDVRDAAREMADAAVAGGLSRDGGGPAPRVGGAAAPGAGRVLAGNRGGHRRGDGGRRVGRQGLRRGRRRLRRDPLPGRPDPGGPRGAGPTLDRPTAARGAREPGPPDQPGVLTGFAAGS